MAELSEDEIKSLKKACAKLSQDKKVMHVGVLNRHGNLVAGGFRGDIESLIDDDKSRIIYQQMNEIFQKRKELDGILGETDYATLRRKNYLLITVPERGDLLILIIAKSDSDDRKIIKKAEELFENVEIKAVGFSYPI